MVKSNYFHYLVPKILSPASPRPGYIYLCSLRPLSIEAMYKSTSGWWETTFSTPSGAPIIHNTEILVTPKILGNL